MTRAAGVHGYASDIPASDFDLPVCRPARSGKPICLEAVSNARRSGRAAWSSNVR